MSWDGWRDEPGRERQGVIDRRARRKRAQLRRKASHDRGNRLAVLVNEINRGQGRRKRERSA